MKRFNHSVLMTLLLLNIVWLLLCLGTLAHHFAMRDVTRIEQLELIGE